MEFLEKDLEEIIFEADRNDLIERGLNIRGKLFRQLKIGNYGIADLVEVSRFRKDGWHEGSQIEPRLFITVYELKKDKIGISAFLQALGYLKGIRQYLRVRKPNIEFILHIVLIGREMTKIHEEFIEGTCTSVHELMLESDNIRGEFSILVGVKKKD